MDALPPLSSSAAAGIAWVYLLTNFARVFTYLPQIVAVWRSRDGARAISLFTWWSWTASNLASMAYGVLVIQDAFFVMISTINFAGCAAVAGIASQRRRSLRRGVRRGGDETRDLGALPASATRSRPVCELTVAVLSCRSGSAVEPALQPSTGPAPLRRRTDVRPLAHESVVEGFIHQIAMDAPAKIATTVSPPARRTSRECI